MKQKRLLSLMGEIEDKYVEEAYAEETDGVCGSKTQSGGKKPARVIWLKWCAVAAGLILVAGLSVAMARSGLLFGKQHEVTLQSGEKITFAKIDEIGFVDQKINATARDLKEEEALALFPGLSVTGYVLFDTDEGDFMGIEGEIGDIDLFVAKKGMMIDDTIVMGEETVSMVNDIEVTAGYFLMRPNSKGEQRIICYANFEMGNTTFGLEYAGGKAEAEKLCTELAGVIEKLIQNGEPDFSNLRK